MTFTWGKLAGIVLAPVVCTLLLFGGVYATLRIYSVLGDAIFDYNSVNLRYLLTILVMCIAVTAAAFWIVAPMRSRSPWVMPALLLPAVVFTFLQLDKTAGKRNSAFVWLAGLTVLILVIWLLTRRSLKWTAWIVGILAAIVAADLAVIAQLSQTETLDHGYAPLWLFMALADYDFGLDPNTWFIGDALDLREVGYSMYALIALGYLMGSQRPAKSALSISA